MRPSDPLLRGRVVRHVRCNRTLKHLFFTSGVHYYELDVARMDKRATGMVVGAVPSESFDSETLNGPLNAWTHGAVGYAAYGAILQNGTEVSTHVEPFNEGDVIGVLLDLNTRTIAFFRNGHRVAYVAEEWRRSPRAVDDLASTRSHDNNEQKRQLVAPLRFASRAMFAAVTFSPATDLFDVYATRFPSGLSSHLPSLKSH